MSCIVGMRCRAAALETRPTASCGGGEPEPGLAGSVDSTARVGEFRRGTAEPGFGLFTAISLDSLRFVEHSIVAIDCGDTVTVHPPVTGAP
jgi:hypothetical protein